MDFVQRHFEKRAEVADSLFVTCKPRKRTRTSLTCSFYCRTHEHEDGKPCRWGGAAKLVFSAQQNTVQLKYEDTRGHAPQERSMFGTLTWRQRQAALRCKSTKTADAYDDVADLPPTSEGSDATSLPPKPVVACFMAKVRRKERLQCDEAAPTSSKSYSPSDFEYMHDRLNADLGGSTAIGSDDMQLLRTDHKLRSIPVDPSFGGRELCAPLICPALVHAVLSRLPQPWNVKLSCDGTYRLLLSDMVLLTVGVSVKLWSKAEGKLCTFRSTFWPLGFAIADVESEEAYTILVKALLDVCKSLELDFDEANILQWHGDMHKGLEAARQATAPSSTRLSDWAHVMGQTSSGPAGLPGLAAKHLGPSASPEMLPWFLQWCRISRYLPAHLFHFVWTHIFNYLVQHSESSLAWWSWRW